MIYKTDESGEKLRPHYKMFWYVARHGDGGSIERPWFETTKRFTRDEANMLHHSDSENPILNGSHAQAYYHSSYNLYDARCNPSVETI